MDENRFDKLPSYLQLYRKHIQRMSQEIALDLKTPEFTEKQVHELTTLQRDGCLFTDAEFDARVAAGLRVDLYA